MSDKYRVVSVIRYTVFGDAVKCPAVQVRVGYFWWVTLTHCENVKQALTYIENVKKRKKDKILGVVTEV